MHVNENLVGEVSANVSALCDAPKGYCDWGGNTNIDISSILVNLSNDMVNINTIKKIIKYALEDASPKEIYDTSWKVYYKMNNIEIFDSVEVDNFLKDYLKGTDKKFGGCYWISPNGEVFDCDEHILLDLAFYNKYVKTEDSFYNKKTVPYFLEQQGYVRWQKDAISFMKEPNIKQFNAIGRLITEFRTKNQGASLYFEADNIVFFKKRYENPHLDEIITDIQEAYGEQKG